MLTVQKDRKRRMNKDGFIFLYISITKQRTILDIYKSIKGKEDSSIPPTNELRNQHFEKHYGKRKNAIHKGFNLYALTVIQSIHKIETRKHQSSNLYPF